MHFLYTRNHDATAILALAALTATAIGCSRGGPPNYQGYVEGKFVYVASSQSGRLDSLSVVRGDTIAAGHPLFGLDDEPEASAMRQARKVLLSSQSKLADLQTGRRPAEIDVTRGQLAQAVAQQNEAQAILQSDEAQYRSGGIPQTELISAQAAADVSAARVRELRADLEVAALPAREQQIKAQVHQIAADRAALSEDEWRLKQKRIASPRQGLVFDTLYREGEWVAAGDPVVELLPPENLEIRFFVPETVIGRLRTGESIRVQCDGCSAAIPAKITLVSPQSEYTPPVIYSNENRSKLVFMIIAKPPVERAVELHPGQPVEVELQ
jgi:HlyD family secretion protein